MLMARILTYGLVSARRVEFIHFIICAAVMPHVEKSALVPYADADMFVLVDAVERYAEFLPWCGGADLIERTDSLTVATIHIDYRGIRQSFTTENAKRRPTEMQMKLRDGPFSRLDGTWRFQALASDACKVSLMLDYGFANALLEKAIGPVFGVIANTMIERFVARADAIYGGKA
jgi:ribosome-associated toxin RatA of RatAB toxin-antitoxin module